MTDNKSFRITNLLRENATVWPISEHYHNVLWDGREDTKRVLSKWVANYIADGSWTKIEETLPQSFKFYYVGNKSLIYTYTKYPDKDRATITWRDKSDNSAQETSYGVDLVRNHISSGDWIVLPSEPEKKLDISSLPIKITVDSAEANKQLAETIAMAEKLEEALKSLKKVLGEDFVKIDVEGIL